MNCTKCDHEQHSGKFCGRCGNELTTVNGAEKSTADFGGAANPVEAGTAAPLYQVKLESSLDVEKVKETSKQYWVYFLEHLKSPSKVMVDPDKTFWNAIITFVIFTLLTTLAVNNIIGYYIGPVDSLGSIFEQASLKPSIIKVFSYVGIALIVVFALSIGSLYAVSKFLGPQTSFKSMTSIIGTLLIPMCLVMLAAFLLLLIDSYGIGSSLFLVGTLFSIFVLPLFVITTLLNKQSQLVDAFYAFIGYILLFTIGISIVLSIAVDSTLSELLFELQYWF